MVNQSLYFVKILNITKQKKKKKIYIYIYIYI
jgi:hypothetical protein